MQDVAAQRVGKGGKNMINFVLGMMAGIMVTLLVSDIDKYIGGDK